MAKFRKYRWIVLILAIPVVGSLFIPLPKEDFRKENVHSLRVLDRNGVVLREYLNDLQGRGQWKSLGEFSPALLEATVAVEDHRFRYHPGIDPFAILRAIRDNIRSGESRSGGSTITQQVIRNVYHHPRTLPMKALEAWYALRLERMMSKNEILEEYLNRVPYGNQLIGAEAAARFYFDKPARDLSLAEAAFLAGLPNAPSFLNPYSNPEFAQKRQKRILDVMVEQERISREEYFRAVQQPIVLVSPDVNFRAPHLVEMAAAEAARFSGAAVVHTTVDYPLQQSIQWSLKGHLKHLRTRNMTNAAVVVIDNKTMNIVALTGSADYFDNEIQGQVNGALARRQPGSSVKPFTYGLAFEGPFTPADLIPDVPTQIPDEEGDYIPENYDRQYHGPVRIRTALACSYNVPAVRVLRQIGKENLLQRLLRAGLTTLDEPSSFYGYGLTLGNGEVTLLELTRAYAAFANNGLWQDVSFIESIETAEGRFIPCRSQQSPRPLFSEQIAFLVTDILRDPNARRPAFGHAFQFPFDCAVKTGTTKDYRDNWTIGYTTDFTVGVWAGNFDGTPMKGVSGITGAGQIFQDIMMILHVKEDRSLPAPFAVPEGLRTETVCATSGKLPNSFCRKTIREWFVKGKTPLDRCTVHRQFRFANEEGEVVEATFEIFPEEYRAWAAEQHLSLPPPDAVPVATVAAMRSEFALLTPQNGQRFKIDPILRKEYQAIRILAHIPADVSRVRVRVSDGKKLSYAADGVWWQLQKGEHRFYLEGIQRGRLVRSTPVSIAVH